MVGEIVFPRLFFIYLHEQRLYEPHLCTADYSRMLSKMEKIWDPLRKKEVALTPEERVRQWFIGILRDNMKVPEHMMMSEVGMKFGTGVGSILTKSSRKEFRADILVYDRNLRPLMVVECKRPEVELTDAVVQQALTYNRVLDVRYITVTNGLKTIICRLQGDTFVPLSKAPSYEEMIR